MVHQRNDNFREKIVVSFCFVCLSFRFSFFDLKDNGQEKFMRKPVFIIDNASSDCSFSEQ